MGFLRAADAISGGSGKAYATIEGKVEELFMIKEFEATLEKNKEELKVLGKLGTQSKAMGFTGTGTMSMYYVTSIFRDLALKYAKTGKDIYFDLTIVNEDATSSVGKQTVVINDVNFDSVMIAKLDVEAAFLDEEMDFTFSDFDLLDRFQTPN